MIAATLRDDESLESDMVSEAVEGNLDGHRPLYELQP